MNPVFWLLVLIGAVVLWLAISFIFIPLGGLVMRKMKGISDIINYEETETETKENESE